MQDCALVGDYVGATGEYMQDCALVGDYVGAIGDTCRIVPWLEIM